MILGEGLVLRAPRDGDRRRSLELHQDAEQLRYGTPAGMPVPQTEADMEERMVRAREAYDAIGPSDLTIAAEAEPDVFLGSISWRYGAPALFRIADVGYAVHPDARGHGVATRALRVLVRWLTAADDGPHLVRVQLDHSVENPASCRTALSAGLAIEGVRPHYLPLRDPDGEGGVRHHDVCLHGFVPDHQLSRR